MNDLIAVIFIFCIIVGGITGLIGGTLVFYVIKLFIWISKESQASDLSSDIKNLEKDINALNVLIDEVNKLTLNI